MLMSLANTHPLRGGIDVGLAAEIGPQEIYGAALGSAYLPESGEAGYPRIVIGDELWRYFNAAIANFRTQTTPVARSITPITERLMGLIAADTDGKRILDHMDSDQLLLFSTDYPHWQFDGDAVLPEGLSSELVQKIMIENPEQTYPRLREAVR